jgi:hypothetical protein
MIKYSGQMNSEQKQFDIAKFIAYFICGILLGLLISLIGGFFHDAPRIMLKEIMILSLVVGLISGFWGQKALDNLFKFFRLL